MSLKFPISLVGKRASVATAVPMEFSLVGDAGNAADPDTGFGSVGYEFLIGTYMVPVEHYDAFNADNSLNSFNISTLQDGTNRPVRGCFGNQVMRFVNWLNVFEGYPPAYRFTTEGSNDYATNWTAGTAGAGWNPARPNVNSLAKYYVPDTNEWYKAAFYSGAGNAYWTYSQQRNSAPNPSSGSTNQNTAIFGGQAGTAEVDNAGGLSYYGTMGQSGQLNEWIIDLGLSDSLRRGGLYSSVSSQGTTLTKTYTTRRFLNGYASDTGVRIAARIL